MKALTKGAFQKEEKRPFTFTLVNEDPYLQFTIKRYEDHHGVTDLLHQLKPGDELIIRDVWGAVEYKGPGYFIAGGAGIAPFLSILRQLLKKSARSSASSFKRSVKPGDKPIRVPAMK